MEEISNIYPNPDKETFNKERVIRDKKFCLQTAVEVQKTTALPDGVLGYAKLLFEWVNE